MAFDFPSSPSEGQVFNAPGGPSYVFNSPLWRAVGQGQIAIIADAAPSNPANGTLWLESDTGLLFAYWNDGNSSQWVQVGGNAATGAIVQTVITTSGTYTKPAGLRYLEVWCVGGGGGSGRAPITAAGQASVCGGGGGGGAVYKLYAASDLNATEAYTIGAGGAGGGAGGVAGGNTTFSGLTAGGGGGGGAGTTASATLLTTSTVGGSGTAVGGDLNIPGAPGGYGIANPHNRPGVAVGGAAGASYFVTVGEMTFTGSTVAGGAGRFPGGGASGDANGASQGSATAGNAGGAGCIILKEYF